MLPKKISEQDAFYFVKNMHFLSFFSIIARGADAMNIDSTGSLMCPS